MHLQRPRPWRHVEPCVVLVVAYRLVFSLETLTLKLVKHIDTAEFARYSQLFCAELVRVKRVNLACRAVIQVEENMLLRLRVGAHVQ